MSDLKLKDKRVLVVGMGLSGRSAVHFLMSQGAKVVAVDRDEQLLITHPEIREFVQKGLKVFKESEWKSFAEVDLLVLSPGVPQTHPVIRQALQEGISVIGEIELGCRIAKNRMLGITGTNGKTTVSLMTAHVLKKNGFDAHALGNVGQPLTKELLTLKPEDLIILELSSYQIETLSVPVLDSGLILNITPDHLDRYGSMDAYAQAKCGLERAIKPGGYLYVEENAWGEFGRLFASEKIRLYGYSRNCYLYTDLASVFVEGTWEFDLPIHLQYKKSHELENLLGAYALCREMGVAGPEFLQAFQSFKKPSHRIEIVSKIRGVHYIDDSKGTNLDAVIRAVEFVQGPIVLIAGGVDKGAPYSPWIEKFRNKVKSVCAIGQAAVKMRDQLAPQIPVIIFDSLEEAVQHAAAEAVEGDTVLLSPGCSSFDMFKDYIHRGEEFQRIVRRLEEKKR